MPRKAVKKNQPHDYDTHKAYLEAAESAKRECDEVLDLLVDDVREAGQDQLADLLRSVLQGSRDADSLTQWALVAMAKEMEIPREKIDELIAIQLTLKAYLTKKRDKT